MPFINKFTATTTICALMGSTAIADVTAEDIWGGIQSYYESMGYQVAVANESKDGDTLTVENFSLSMDIPDEDETLRVSGMSISFEELSDGSVSVTVPEEMTVSAEVDDVLVDLLLTTKDVDIIASGEPADVNYEMSVGSYEIALKQIREGDVAFLPKMIATMTALKGSMQISQGDMTNFAYDFTSDALNIDVDVKEPDSENSLKALINMTGITLDSTSTVPNDLDMEQIAEALNNGMTGEGSFGYSGATFDVSVVDGSDGADITGSTQNGSIGFRMSAEGMGYNTASSNTELTVVPAMMPLPIKVEIAETASEFLFPVSKSDTPQDVKIMAKYEGLSIDEAIWGMFDPAAVLPRTPATVLIDLSAQMSWDIDVLDPANIETLDSSTFPGKLYSATINAVKIAAAGAEFTGDGAFTFDYDNPGTFEGLPAAPEGEVNLKLTGGNGLLDKLIEMGFVAQEDAMGIRMMSGLFANAGPGEDELISKIEVNADGSVLANGQRIK